MPVYISMGALQRKDHPAGSGNLHWFHSNSSGPASYILKRYPALPSEIDIPTSLYQHGLKFPNKAVSPTKVFLRVKFFQPAPNFELYIEFQGPQRWDLYFFFFHRRENSSPSIHAHDHSSKILLRLADITNENQRARWWKNPPPGRR